MLMRIYTRPLTSPAKHPHPETLQRPHKVQVAQRIGNKTVVTIHTTQQSPINSSQVIDRLCILNLFTTTFYQGPQQIIIHDKPVTTFVHNAHWQPAHDDSVNSFLTFVDNTTHDIIAFGEFHTSKYTMQQTDDSQYQQLIQAIRTTSNTYNPNTPITLYETKEHNMYFTTRTKVLTTIPQQQLSPTAKAKSMPMPQPPTYPPPLSMQAAHVDIINRGEIGEVNIEESPPFVSGSEDEEEEPNYLHLLDNDNNVATQTDNYTDNQPSDEDYHNTNKNTVPPAQQTRKRQRSTSSTVHISIPRSRFHPESGLNTTTRHNRQQQTFQPFTYSLAPIGSGNPFHA